MTIEEVILEVSDWTFEDLCELNEQIQALINSIEEEDLSEEI
jgi:hypothetical protein